MTRKRLIKVLMSLGLPRNMAVVLADACNGHLSHLIMLGLVLSCPEFLEIVDVSLPQILQGAKLTIAFE